MRKENYDSENNNDKARYNFYAYERRLRLSILRRKNSAGL